METNNGNLSFSGGFDNTQLRADFVRTKTEFKGLGDAAKAEGVRVEQAFNAAAAASTVSFQKSTASLKDQITQQRQIIREITGDIKQLGIAAADATGGKKSELLGDLKGARKALAEEQASMIGLQRQQIEGNGKEAESHGGIIAGLGKWAIGLASVTGALAIGKSIMESTEATAHAFEQGVAAAGAATHYLFQSIASGDWSNFTDGMTTAINGAIEYVNAMEEVNNLGNQDKIASAEFDKKIAVEREKTYDKGKDNNTERLKAYNEMISLTEQKFNPLIETAQKKYDTLLKKASTDTGGKTSTAEIDTFISKYRSVKDMIEEGEKYNNAKGVKLIAPMSGGFSPTMGNAAEYDRAQAQLKAMGKEGQAAGEKAFNISKIIFPVRDAIAEAKSNLIGLQAQLEQGNTFVKRSKGSLENKMESDAIAAAKKAKEDAELDNRIKATQDIMKTASGKELEDLAKKLVLLEAEKKLRDAIQKSVMAMYANKPIESRGATSAYVAIGEALGVENTQPNSTTQAKSVTDRLKADGDKAMADTIRRQKAVRVDTASQEKESEASLKAQRKRTDDLAEGFYLVADAAKNFANIIGDSNKELAGTISAVANLAGQMGDLVKKGAFTAGGMKPEDAIGAGIVGATQILGVILGQAQANKKAQDEWTASIEQAAQAFVMLSIESLAYKEANLFGVENPYARAIAGANQYGVAMGELAKAASKLEGGQVQTGTKKVASGSNIVSAAAGGAVIGAAIGGGILSIPAAVIGGVVGGLIGLLAAKKSVPVFESLKKQYGEIYNKDTFELNPKILADYGKLDAATKAMVDNWKELKATAKAAQDEMTANFKTLAGDLGTSLKDAIINAFRNGELDSAIGEFHTKVGDVIADLIYQMLFAQFMQPFFDKAQEGFNNSMGIITDANTGKSRTMTDKEKLAKDPSGKLIADGTITDDLEVLGNDIVKGVEGLNGAMTEADTMLKGKGFANGLGGSTGAKDNSMKGQITAALTEDTATELKGLWNRQSIDIRGILELGKASSSHLLNIAANTLRTADNTDGIAEMKVSLKSIDTAVNKTASRL